MNSRSGKSRRTMVGISLLHLSLCLSPLGAAAQGTKHDPARAKSHLAEQVRKELVLLPYYGRNWTLGLGYRMLEGGADVEDVYAFGWLHYAAASISVRF